MLRQLAAHGGQCPQDDLILFRHDADRKLQQHALRGLQRLRQGFTLRLIRYQRQPVNTLQQSLDRLGHGLQRTEAHRRRTAFDRMHGAQGLGRYPIQRRIIAARLEFAQQTGQQLGGLLQINAVQFSGNAQRANVLGQRC